MRRRGPAPTPAIVRFERRIQPGPGGCWLWQGRLNHYGYGTFKPTVEVTTYAHRWSYEYHVAAVPEGLELDHLCRVRNCVNPEHLEPVTHAENQRRMRRPTCFHGHPMTPENTYIRRDGRGRQCRTCKRNRQREFVQRTRKTTPPATLAAALT